jgi:hypothetical protein
MKQVSNWLSQFQSWAHWFAGAALSAALIYSTNEAAHKAVNQALSGAPKVAAFIASVSAVVLAFANSKKSQ